MPSIIYPPWIVRILHSLLLLATIIFLMWFGGPYVRDPYQAGRILFGVTPISAVREVLLKEGIVGNRGSRGKVDTFHALLSQPWGNEVIVLYEVRKSYELQDRSDPWLCYAFARPATRLWEQDWESGYSSKNCYDLSHPTLRLPESNVFRVNDDTVITGQERKWIIFGKVNDPRVTTIEVTTVNGEVGTTPVINDGFLITVPPSHEMVCRIRAFTNQGEAIEDYDFGRTCKLPLSKT